MLGGGTSGGELSGIHWPKPRQEGGSRRRTGDSGGQQRKYAGGVGVWWRRNGEAVVGRPKFGGADPNLAGDALVRRDGWVVMVMERPEEDKGGGCW